MKCFISVVHQYCDDLRISRSAIPEGSIGFLLPLEAVVVIALVLFIFVAVDDQMF